MKWTHYPIPAVDDRAKQHVLESISIAANNHTLAKKLLTRFSLADGPIFAIAMEGIDVQQISGYRFSQRYSGSFLSENYSWVRDIPVGDRPIDGLISFLFDYLAQSPESLAIIEDLVAKSTDRNQSREMRAAYGIKSKRAFFNDEVLYIIASGDKDRDIAEDTIRSADYWWLNGVCVSKTPLPESDCWSERFLDDLITRTDYIFVSAFDGEGYLVWAPS